MDYSIVWVRGHVEVFDWAGRFCFSADSEREALEELDVSVDGAELTEGGDGTLGVRVYLTWRGEPLQAEVEI